MSPTAPPVIFARHRRFACRRRMLALQARPGAARYVLDDMIEDVLDRLSFLRHAPARAAVIGEHTHRLADALSRAGGQVASLEPARGFDEECPLEATGLDLIVSLGVLDTVNDLPGALVHLRRALAPGGLMIASFCGAGSLPRLRAAMLSADGARPAPRLHPQVDVRAGGQLLLRAGFADPVVDSRGLQARFGSLDALVADLRAQGLSNVLARPGPPLGRRALEAARSAFTGGAPGARVTETFEILTLSGRAR